MELASLNIAYNRLCTLSFPSLLPNLRLLDVSHNQISLISHLSYLPSLQELYISHNFLANVHSVSVLRELRLLDVGNNRLNSLEAVAGVGGNRKLMVLKVVGNPICRRNGYIQDIKRLFPWLHHLNPSKIHDFSEFSHSPPSLPASFPCITLNFPLQASSKIVRISTPLNFHTLTSTEGLSTDRSYRDLTSRLSGQSNRSGFWSNTRSNRSSLDKCSRPKESEFKKPEKVPKLLLDKVKRYLV